MEHLPLEILLLVVDNLNDQDLLSARLTCTRLWHASRLLRRKLAWVSNDVDIAATPWIPRPLIIYPGVSWQTDDVQHITHLNLIGSDHELNLIPLSRLESLYVAYHKGDDNKTAEFYQLCLPKNVKFVTIDAYLDIVDFSECRRIIYANIFNAPVGGFEQLRTARQLIFKDIMFEDPEEVECIKNVPILEFYNCIFTAMPKRLHCKTLFTENLKWTQYPELPGIKQLFITEDTNTVSIRPEDLQQCDMLVISCLDYYEEW